MSPSLHRDRRAIVIGAGVSGLLTARVLADHYGQVTLVERDELPPTPRQRRGVPQGAHVHALFARGVAALEELLPGFGAALTGSGAHRIDMGRDLALATPYGWGVRHLARLPALGASRPLIEHVIRARATDSPRLTLLTGHRVIRLTGRPEHLDGVEARHGSTDRHLPADLVVDAAGRASPLDRWLAELDCPAPPARTVDAHVGYATRLFRTPAGGVPADWRACYSLPLGPSTPRGGVLAPVEGDRWIITLTGTGDHRPGTTDDDFLPFARSLLTPLIADFAARAEPLTAVRGSNATANRLRRPGHAGRLPGNLLVTGDSACALNPVYAQGMTVAALSALALRDCLTAAPPRPGPDRLAHRFHQAQSAVQRLPWLLATSADNLHPGTTGTRPGLHHQALAHALHQLLRAGAHHPEAQRRSLSLMAMTAGPATLTHPRALLALATYRRHPATPTGHPPPPAP
ncbi:NAD(P)/FAD-dependent oxidoreductase [Streptomyces lichenis]|uniref:FAD-binding domain-containing protein n=1 Tax=Streptomyces lichenis TaxID=2306967 RepID=A0ABT0IAS9_9ACTN|nr:FAD-dependent monooxygenase [Streptomyces lichenis]MCK8678423.1 hypothetical protein [Streptomyces lichenis]